MTNLHCSLPTDAVVWNKDDERYSIIAPTASTEDTKASNDTTATTTSVAVTAGWAKATDGTWSYNKADGTKATGWLQDGSVWYYLNASGAMLANTTVDGYVLGANGAWVK